jgi:hypothetical protein
VSAPEVNEGRRLAFATFEETLSELHGRPGVTEVGFRDAWHARLRAIDALTTNGWYEPPPLGMAVLFAGEDDPSRISFESLRLPRYAPGPETIEWSRGLMYAYCSPLHRTSGLAGDFGVTLYFGDRSDVRAHFRRAFAVTRDLLAEIGPRMRSGQLLERSQALFEEAGLTNTIASVTDSVPLDLGHSLPKLDRSALDGRRELDGTTIAALRNGRRFVSESADWALSREDQVTIEPQLVALGKPELPQVSFHYVVAMTEERTVVLRECDALLDRFGLTE